MTNPSGTTLRVLVIEDDADFAPKLRRGLRELGTNADLVECVDDAVEALARNRYDLVLVDIWLPKSPRDLEEKRTLEVKYDNLTRELIASEGNERRKAKLREEMERTIAEGRTKLERRGGLMVLESPECSSAKVGAILFLTAIGNEDMCQDAAKVVTRIGCSRFDYLVKPQAPEVIYARARQLLQ